MITLLNITLRRSSWKTTEDLKINKDKHIFAPIILWDIGLKIPLICRVNCLGGITGNAPAA